MGYFSQQKKDSEKPKYRSDNRSYRGELCTKRHRQIEDN